MAPSPPPDIQRGMWRIGEGVRTDPTPHSSIHFPASALTHRKSHERGRGTIGGRGKITASCFQSNSWRSNRMLGPGGRQEAGDVVRGQQEGATNFWNVPTYFYRVTRRVILKKFPTPPHASNFCLRVNDVVTRIMTRLPSSAFGK